jgi:ComF family protein
VKIFKSLISVLFPNVCVSCSDIIEEGEFLCDYCYEMIERTANDKICIKCGNMKKRCECKRRVYRFNAIIAPFYNEGIARKALYAFKIGKREAIANFFINEMTLAIKQNFYDIKFDEVCFVPMFKRDRLKKGFNHSELLAKGIAEKLGIKFSELLLSHKKKKPQHKLHPKERLENVKDVYYCNKNLSGKTILLVDDIKTTGATLDECSKQLLFAGAERVYCVTGVMSRGIDRNKKKGENNGN